jgi:hypothetical protein
MTRNDRPDPSNELWSWIDREKATDRRVRRIGNIAWTLSLIAVALYGVGIVAQLAPRLADLKRGYGGSLPRSHVLAYALEGLLPFITVVGIFSFLVAVLSTIGMFLRFRTASLAEIQTRLAAMEKMLTSEQAES